MPLAEVIIRDMAQDLEDEGLLGDAEDCRELLNCLARETGLDHGPGSSGTPNHPCVGPFAFEGANPDMGSA